MRRAHGPYRHRNRWRMIVTEDDGSQTATSFATQPEAEAAIRAEQVAIMGAAQGGIVASLSASLPEDPAWIYFLHDDQGAVIYVGVTGNIASRMQGHAVDKQYARATYLPNVMPRRLLCKPRQFLCAC